MTTRGERLREARLKAGFRSARAAALALGLPVATYNAHERAGSPGGRDYGPEEAARYARRFRTSDAWLLTGRDRPAEDGAAGAAATAARGSAATILIRGEVAAGVWFEVEGADTPDFGTAPFGPDPRYPAEAQYSVIVRGTSINRIASQGDLLHCVDLRITGANLEDGDLAIVERRRMQGGQVEYTAKRVRRRGGRVELVPDSTDPAWQEPVALDPKNAPEGEEIAPIARVLGVYRPLTRGRRP